MGEPEPGPLDLELLQRGDENEIRRAITELGLMQLAQSIVFKRIGSRYGFDVRAVANAAIQKLFSAAIHDVDGVEAITPMLATIAKRTAINFVNVASRKRERELEQELLETQCVPQEAAAAPDPYEIMQNLVVEGLGLEAFDLGRVLAAVIELSELTATEELLLTEHILGGMTQQEFSDIHGVAHSGIGGRKDRLLMKIRTALSARSGDIREILRRNRELRLMNRR